MRRFRLRRLGRVNAEALLIASGQNIKRLVEFGGRKPEAPAQVAALRPPDTTQQGIHRSRRHRATRLSRPTR